MLQDFKKFALRGNVIDLAVGVMIGAAFGKIVTSLVGDILMPALGMLIGKIDFTNLFIVLHEGTTAAPYATLLDAQKAGAVTINIGLFLNNSINFLIMAFAIFLMVKAISKLQRKEETPAEAPPAPTPEDIELLREIRDLLKK